MVSPDTTIPTHRCSAATEIDSECYALKVIRGDFDELPEKNGELDEREIGRIMEAVNR